MPRLYRVEKKMAELYKNKYRVPSARAEWCNYDGGRFFVTICCKGRRHYLGEIEGDEMKMTALGGYLTEMILSLPNHYPFASVPLFVVMPNHLHLMIDINGNAVETRHAASQFAENEETRHVASLQGKRLNMPLSCVVGGLKSSLTRYAHKKGFEFAWQPRFYEHIVRNVKDNNEIASYIKNNVIKWSLDDYYS